MFDPDYCRLRPYHSDSCSKGEFLISKGIIGSAKGWQRIWHRASMYYLDACNQIFVRHDHSEELNNLVVRIMRDDLPTPTECLFHPSPVSTVNCTIDVIKRFTRMARHFSHPTVVLMVLSWAELASNLYARWKNEDRFNARDCKSIEKRFKQLERVQFMEKNRFFEVADALPPGQLRTRLLDLWEITYN